MLNAWKWLLAATLLLAGGCNEPRYEWSPDGQHLSIIAADGLHLADSKGQLLPGVIEGADLAAWFADSQHLAVAREMQVGTWEAISPSLTSAQRSIIEKAAGEARNAVLEYDWDDPQALQEGRFLAFVKQRATDAHRDPAVFDQWTIPIAIYLEDHRDAALTQTAPASWWKQLDALKQTVTQMAVYHYDGTHLALDASLMSTLAGVADVRPSPTGKNVLISADGGPVTADLWVAPADGKQPPLLATHGAAAFADWSPDGRQLFCMTDVITNPNEIAGGKLERLTVADPSGKLCADPPARQQLCRVNYISDAKVRAFHDGRVVFSNGPESGIHKGTFSPPKYSGLFYVDGAIPAPPRPLLPHEIVDQFGDYLQTFEPSPSGTRIFVADMQGKVWVVDLSSKQVRMAQNQTVLNDQNQPSLISLPHWRSDDVLTLIAHAVGGPAVVDWSWSTQKTTPLGGGWPAPLRPLGH